MESTQNQINDSNLLNISEEEDFRKSLQAYYYMMNAKPDSKTKLFTKDVCINLDDSS